MDSKGLYMFKGFYIPCDDCDGEADDCPTCEGDGWIETDNEDWHPYGTEFAEYDRLTKTGYFKIVMCTHCGYKMSILFEFNIVDEQYHTDIEVCGNCDNELKGLQS